MDYFWERYSKELDSWRDQPLWAYTLCHLNIQPTQLYIAMHGDFSRQKKRHTYNKNTDNDATAAAK